MSATSTRLPYTESERRIRAFRGQNESNPFDVFTVTMARKLLFAALGAFAALFLVRIYAFGPSDTQLIWEALDRSCQASRRGEPGGVMDQLSRSLTFNEEPVEDRHEIAKAIRLSKPEVTLAHSEPAIQGRRAQVVTSARVRLNYAGVNIDQSIPRVVIRLQKETGFRWLVMPYPKWRVVDVTVEEMALPSIGLQ